MSLDNISKGQLIASGLFFAFTYGCIRSVIKNYKQYQQANEQKLSILQLRSNKNKNQATISEALQQYKTTKYNKRILIQNVLPHFNGKQFSISTKTGSSKNENFKEVINNQNFEFVGYDHQSNSQKTPYLIQCQIKETNISNNCLTFKEKYVPQHQLGITKTLKRFSPLAIVGAIGLSIDQTIQLKAQFIGTTLQDILGYYEVQQNWSFFLIGLSGCLGILTGWLSFYFAYNAKKRNRD